MFCSRYAKKIGVEDHAIFDDFAQAGPVFAVGQRGKHFDVDQHALGLPESADHIFCPRQIDTNLAADRAIDLGEQCRRHLKKL